MKTENAVPQLLPSNKTPRRRSAKRQCSRCRYALYPNTGRCTNYECPRYRRGSGAISAAQLVHEYAKPELFHGRHWGSWTLDAERFCLVFEAQPMWRGRGRDRYLAYLSHYEIDLERIATSASMLDWIFQIRCKAWATSVVQRDLLNALHDLFDPQGTLCSFAIGGSGGKTIAKPSEFIRRRIAMVGKARGAE